VGHINVRSLKQEVKIKELFTNIKDNDIALMVATETWDMPTQTESKEYLFTQSKKDKTKAGGIIIIADKTKISCM
jgi:hypothetical protein